MFIQDWSSITAQALQSAWESTLLFLPELLGAIVIFIIGWIISIGVGKFVAELLKKLKFNKLFDKTGWEKAFKKADISVDPSHFIGAIVKWILVIVFLMIASDILNWTAFSLLLAEVIAWLPNLVVAIAILIVAIVIADILEKLVMATVERIGVKSSNLLGALVRWSIYVFAILAILLQLGITPTIVNTLIIGFVAMISLAVGLSFGLGGKEHASEIIGSIRKKFEEK